MCSRRRDGPAAHAQTAVAGIPRLPHAGHSPPRGDAPTAGPSGRGALARQHTDTILPGYSFGQHAQPMTLAHLWLSWAANLARDFDRLHGVYRRVNVSPAGAAIMVGSDFPLNRRRTAELLGFDAIHE